MYETIIFIMLTILVLVYVLCKAASFDDRERERMSRTWDYDDEDFFKHNKPK